jgi:hypothetical protein
VGTALGGRRLGAESEVRLKNSSSSRSEYNVIEIKTQLLIDPGRQNSQPIRSGSAFARQSDLFDGIRKSFFR